jgi:hypothetical protein
MTRGAGLFPLCASTLLKSRRPDVHRAIGPGHYLPLDETNISANSFRDDDFQLNRSISSLEYDAAWSWYERRTFVF